MQDSIFTKIIKGEIPSHKIYEDEHTFAFLDIHPVTTGHVLVVPKEQVEFVWDLDDETYMHLMRSVKTIARHLRDVSGKPYVGQHIVGTDVPHAHIHLMPFTDSSELHNDTDPATAEPNHDILAALAEKLAL